MNTDLDQQHLDKLEDIAFQPVFIQGLHRSGTTILYKMLSATGCFNPVTAYHIIEYDHLLDDYLQQRVPKEKEALTMTFRQNGLDDRGIDRLKITADFAEEYGFLLGNKSGRVSVNSWNLPVFTELCKKIQYTANNNNPILLKNPYDFGKSLFLKTVFPEAKFVFIHRHPYKTMSSLVKAVRVLMNEKNLYASHLFRRYNILFENPLLLYPIRFLINSGAPLGTMILTEFAWLSIHRYLRTIDQLPTRSYVSLRYEELCTQPQKHMERILKTLDITPKVSLDFSTYIKPRKTTIDPTVLQLRGFIYKMMKKYFQKLGYSTDDYLTN